MIALLCAVSHKLHRRFSYLIADSVKNYNSLIFFFLFLFFFFIYDKIRITFSQEGRQSLIAFAFQCLACQHELSLWGPPMLPRTVAVATGESALQETVCPASIRNQGR